MSLNWFPRPQEFDRTPRRASSARAVGQLLDEQGNGIANAAGSFDLWRNGTHILDSGTMAPDGARGVGYCSILISDSLLATRGDYRWRMRLVSPDGTLATTLWGEFTL